MSVTITEVDILPVLLGFARDSRPNKSMRLAKRQRKFGKDAAFTIV